MQSVQNLKTVNWQRFFLVHQSDRFFSKSYHKIAELPPIKELLEEIKIDDYASAISVQAEKADPMPTIPQMSFVLEPLEGILYSIIKNGDPIESVLDLGVEGKDENSGKLIEICLSDFSL